MAGVSLSTVSRVFNSPELVREQTREKVLRLAQEHRYVYNANAAELPSNKSRVLGLLGPSTQSPLFADAMTAIESRLCDTRYSLVIGSTNHDPALEKLYLTRLLERRVAGIIMTGFSIGQEHLVEQITAQGIPCVIIWEMLEPESPVSYVGYDNYNLAVSAVEYLFQLQHRRIGLIIGRMNVLARLRKRLQGYKDVLACHGVPYDPDLVVQRRIPSYLEGKQAMEHLLKLNDPPSAVYVTSDEMALGGMNALWEQGYKVPEDMSVIGSDDIMPAAYSIPPLSTVAVPAREMGKQAIDILLEMLETGDHAPRHYKLDTNLIIRQSCAEYSSFGKVNGLVEVKGPP